MSEYKGNTPIKGVHIEDPWLYNIGPKTAAQTFVEAYAANIEAEAYKAIPLTKWYSPNAIFYAQNNTIYHGAEAIGEWMRGQSSESLRNILPFDGDSTVVWRAIRQLWIKGNKREDADVDVPMLWICKIGKAESEDGFGGLQYKEIHLSWDTAKVAQLMRERGLAAYQGVA